MPARPGRLRALVVGVALALALVGGLEGFWRARGFTPSVADDGPLWVYWRARADGRSPAQAVTLVGSSRFESGLDLDTVRDATGRAVVQLSIGGGSPLVVLHDLASDEKFRGLALVEVLPHKAFTADEPEPFTTPWIDEFHRRPWISDVETVLRAAAATRLTFLQPMLAHDQLFLEWRRTRRLPQPPPTRLGFDRQRISDYSHVDPAALAALVDDYEHAGRPATAAELDRRIAAVDADVRAIAARGGRVVLFRMISSSPIREIEARRFPDERYWSRFRRAVAAPTLSWDEVPALRGFHCAEGAHLDRRDSAPFTAALIAALRERGLL